MQSFIERPTMTSVLSDGFNDIMLAIRMHDRKLNDPDLHGMLIELCERVRTECGFELTPVEARLMLEDFASGQGEFLMTKEAINVRSEVQREVQGY